MHCSITKKETGNVVVKRMLDSIELLEVIILAGDNNANLI